MGGPPTPLPRSAQARHKAWDMSLLKMQASTEKSHVWCSVTPYSTKNRKIENKFHRKQPPSQIHRKKVLPSPPRSAADPCPGQVALLTKTTEARTPALFRTAHGTDPLAEATTPLAPPPRHVPAMDSRDSPVHRGRDTRACRWPALQLAHHLLSVLQPGVGRLTKREAGQGGPRLRSLEQHRGDPDGLCGPRQGATHTRRVSRAESRRPRRNNEW